MEFHCWSSYQAERVICWGAFSCQVFSGAQHPGTFVVNFPKGYHAGFSTGFNVAEVHLSSLDACISTLVYAMVQAVNIALPQWFPFGYDCIRMYSALHRTPPFCIQQVTDAYTHNSHMTLYCSTDHASRSSK